MTINHIDINLCLGGGENSPVHGMCIILYGSFDLYGTELRFGPG